MSESSEGENLNRPGLFVLNIEDPEAGHVALLSGKIVVDARNHPRPNAPNRANVSPGDFRKLGELFGAVRGAYVNKQNMNDALLQAAKKLGFDATEAKVIGQAPKHWELTRR